MLKVLSLVLIVAFMSAAFAADPDPDLVVRDALPAVVDQGISVTIPERAALHVTDGAWILNLNSDADIAEYCWFLSKANAAMGPDVLALIGLAATRNPGGWLEPAAGFGYPAIRPNDPGISDLDKGYLVCALQKVVQLFSNDPDGHDFTITFSGAPAGGFGVFGLTSSLASGTTAIVANGADLLTTTSTNTTGGWLDHRITEGFFFDGSEEAGTYNLVVTYTLANLAPPPAPVITEPTN